MNFGVLGTGVVGQAIATKLTQLGHTVKMGSRSATNEKATGWAEKAGEKASAGTFADAAAFGDVVVLATKGDVTLDILELAGKENFKGKTVIDISNPLDFSKGMPPTLSICNDNSLGEEVQKFIPADVPLLGIYSGVEIGKIGADVQALDWTGVLCVFSQ